MPRGQGKGNEKATLESGFLYSIKWSCLQPIDALIHWFWQDFFSKSSKQYNEKVVDQSS